MALTRCSCHQYAHPLPHTAVRCSVFKCITLCFKVSFHNLWPPTLQHWLSRCLDMLHIPRPPANKHREMNCMPFIVFISFVSRCSPVHPYQTAFSLVEHIWNACVPLNDIRAWKSTICVCVCAQDTCWYWSLRKLRDNRTPTQANSAFTKNLSAGLLRWEKYWNWIKVTIWVEPWTFDLLGILLTNSTWQQ